VPRTAVPSTGPLYHLCSFRSAVGRRHGRSQPPCARPRGGDALLLRARVAAVRRRRPNRRCRDRLGL
jgi:hypothetical protein